MVLAFVVVAITFVVALAVVVDVVLCVEGDL